MENNKSNNELSETLRKKLENFPEEFPAENNWQELRSRMKSEGLLRKASRKKRYTLLLFLLLIIISGVITIPLLVNKQSYVSKTDVYHDAETEKTNEQKNKNKENILSPNKNINITNEEKNKPKNIEKSKAKYPFKSLVKSDTQKKNNTLLAGKILSDQSRVTAENGEHRIQNEQTSNESSSLAEVTGKKGEDDIKDTEPTGVGGEVKGSQEAEIHGEIEITSVFADSSRLKNISETTSVNIDSVVTAQPDIAKTDSSSATTRENETGKENSHLRKVRLGFFVSWDRNSYHLKKSSNAEDEAADFITNSDSINGKKSAGQFTLGLRGSYYVTSKIAVEAGVFYSQKRKVDAVIYTPQYSSSAGNSISDFAYHFDARYFEIEQRIKYSIWQKKPSVYIAAGAKENFNLDQSNPDYFEHTIYNESAAPRTDRVLLKPASMQLSLALSAGLELPLGERSSFFFEPSYTYALDPVINNPVDIMVPVNLYRRSFSFGTGLNYKF